MVKFRTRLGKVKRSKKSLTARERYQTKSGYKIVEDIIKSVLQRVENEKQSSQDCKIILNEVLQQVLKACRSPKKTGKCSKESEPEPNVEVSSDDDYNFFNDPTFLEEIDRRGKNLRCKDPKYIVKAQEDAENRKQTNK